MSEISKFIDEAIEKKALEEFESDVILWREDLRVNGLASRLKIKSIQFDGMEHPMEFPHLVVWDELISVEKAKIYEAVRGIYVEQETRSLIRKILGLDDPGAPEY